MKSMTAYASVLKRGPNGQSVQVVCRSINFKYLDVHVNNLAPQHLLLEDKIKNEFKKKISRGKIEVYVFVKNPGVDRVCINQQVLGQYVQQIKQVSKKYKISPQIHIGDLLSLPHVVSWQEEEAKEFESILPAVRQVVEKMVEFKIKEGRIIKQEMQKNINRLALNVSQMKKQKPKAASPDNAKEDIDEELSLMSFYLDKLSKKINTGNDEQLGKAVDFLTQEILRELNAASSKTKIQNLGSLIVESKSYLERIREQANNIE